MPAYDPGLPGRTGRRGHDLDFSVGIALGYATLGQIGFDGRYDYGAVGSVLNLASRLCDEAEAGQILVNDRVFEVEDLVEAEPAGELTLKGFAKPVTAFQRDRGCGWRGGRASRPGTLRNPRRRSTVATVRARGCAT